MNYKTGLILIVLCLLFACERAKSPTNSPLGFFFESSYTGCKESFGKTVQTSGGGSVILSSFNDTIRVVHANALYNCCAEIKTDVVKTRLGFDVFEIDEGDTCDCMCRIDVTTFICRVPVGTYLIKIRDTKGNLVDRGYVIVRRDDSGGPGEP
jgi:hypothetical protein